MAGASAARRLLLRGGSGTLAVAVGGLGAAMGAQLVLANTLGPVGYGRYVLPLNWMAVLLLPALVGMDTASVRFVAKYRAEGAWDLLGGYLRLSRALPVLAGAVLGLGALAGATVLGLDPAIVGVFRWMAVLLPVTALLRVVGAHTQGMRHVVASRALDQIVRPLLLAAGVGSVALAGGTLTAPRAMALHVAAAALALAGAVVFWRRVAPVEIRTRRNAYRGREWLGVSSGLLLLASFRVLMGRTDVLMVGALLGTTEAGIIAVVDRLGQVVAIGLTAVNVVMAPMISEFHASGDREGLQDVLTQATWWTFALTVAGASGMAVLGPWVLGWFGDAFTSGYTALLLVCLGQLVNGMAGSVGFLMAMTGNHRVSTAVVGATSVLNIFLNLVLIPRYGINGAALATAVSLVVSNVALAVLVRRILGLRSTVLPW